MSQELLTVDAAAEALSLHAKTVLRHIREGRLRATKVGKQYRILRSDLQAFAGTPVRDAARARATAVVDVDDVDDHLLQRLTAILLGARRGAGEGVHLSIDVAHDPVRRSAKVIAVGAPADLAMVLKLLEACLGET